MCYNDGDMYIKTNRVNNKGKISTSKLLCESYWDGFSSRTRTIMNLSKLPSKQLLAVEQSLKDKGPKVHIDKIKITKSIDYGYAAAILDLMEKLRVSETFTKTCGDEAPLALLMIIGKIITKGSKLAIVNWIKRNEFIANKLGVNIKHLNEKDLYRSLGDIDNLQEKIEHKWGLYHKKKINSVYLYDITSFYFEGTQNELARKGYDRDKQKGSKEIITAGLITNDEGFPLKVEVFKGNILDQKTVKKQIVKIKEDFGVDEIIFVGDRGMKIRYNLEGMTSESSSGVKYITGLTTEEIKHLETEKIIQLSLFDKDLVEIEDGEKRYILCVNPYLEHEKQEKRASRKSKFEKELAVLQGSYNKKKSSCETNQERLAGGDKNKKLKTELSDKDIDSLKYRLRKAKEKYKMQKIYNINIDKTHFTIEYNAVAYEEAGKYDGKYVFETTVKKEILNAEGIRNKYKQLQQVEHAFRDIKTDKLHTRPVYHRLTAQTRGHVFISMFAYAIIQEFENKLFPWLREDAQQKEKLSINDIFEELKSIKLNVLSFGKGIHTEIKITELTQRQKKVFELLNIKESVLLK
jgi:transposase